MSVQFKKHTASKARRRRSHHALKKVTLNKCPKCGKAVLPHSACSFCGSYKGREAVKVKTKAKKAKTAKNK
jgi:large subunit ribosomal protein L32